LAILPAYKVGHLINENDINIVNASIAKS